MIGAVFLALATLVGVASAVLAWSHVQRVIEAGGGDLATLARGLKRLPADQRIDELERRSQPGTWPHDLAIEVRAATTDEARVAAINLALSDVEHALVEGAGWPRAGVRIALLGAAFFAFTAYLVDGGEIKWSLTSAAIGGVAALVCVEAGRSASRRAAAERAAIDDLVAAAFGALEGSPSSSAAMSATLPRRARPRGGPSSRARVR